MTQRDWQQSQVDRIGEAVKALRGDRSAQWLSDATDTLGLRVNRSTISDIETGRRKYVALHELTIIAAALGTTPTTLMTYGTVPDGDLELLPGRTVSGIDAVDWFGGTPLSRFSPAAVGLPADHEPTAQLIAAARERNTARDAWARTQIGGMSESDPALADALKDRLTGIIRRIRELGGVIKDESGDG